MTKIKTITEKAKLSILVISLIMLTCCLAFLIMSADKLAPANNALEPGVQALNRAKAFVQQGSYALTFQDRVDCSKAIERISYKNRLWSHKTITKPSFEQAVSEDIIKSRVIDVMKKSNAMEHYWQHPITGEMLQSEIDRMAKSTRNPDMLQQIWDALNNDPHVIAECLARPILVEKLIRNYYVSDRRFHGELKEAAEKDLRKYSSVAQLNLMSRTYTEKEIMKVSEDEAEKVRAQENGKVVAVDKQE